MNFYNKPSIPVLLDIAVSRLKALLLCDYDVSQFCDGSHGAEQSSGRIRLERAKKLKVGPNMKKW